MGALAVRRVAIIGQGHIAAAYRDVLAVFPELVLVGVTDPKLCSTHPMSSQLPRLVRGTEDLLESDSAPDIALICTPPAGHLEEVSPLLRAGIDVLIECPLALTQHEAEEITSLAERLGRVAMTAERFRVFNAVIEAKRLIDQGRIGRLAHVEATCSYKLEPSQSWAGNVNSPGGVWLAEGSDCLDVVEMLAGPVEKIRMLQTDYQQGADVEDEVRVETEHGGGLVSHMHLSWNHETTAPIARCAGETGEILVGWAQSVLRTEEREQVIAGGFDRHDVCRSLLTRFLRERQRLEPTEDRGGQTLGWIEAAYRSLHNSHWERA